MTRTSSLKLALLAGRASWKYAFLLPSPSLQPMPRLEQTQHQNAWTLRGPKALEWHLTLQNHQRLELHLMLLML